MSTSKTFLLIHGAWEGAWAWKETTEFLENQGHKVISIDLPGHGNNKTPISEINLELYANSVKSALDNFSNPVTLVAHSFAGYVISKVAEEVPQKIKKLIFVASALPYDGKPAIKIFEEDTDSDFLANLIFSDDQSVATMNRETIKNIVFGGATDAQIDEVIPQLVEQATKPFFEVVETTEKNFGSVAKAYIETKYDRVLSLGAQRMLQEKIGITESVLLETGHVPLVTTPEELANALIKVA
ncbi:MAG: alpha/beta fold hydrolase [Flavobacteriaceae bacterium]